MPSYPALEKTICHNPHVVILGAGASLAAFPNGDARGNRLPLMNNIIGITGLGPLLSKAGKSPEIRNFEAFYSDLVSSGKDQSLVLEIQDRIREYFSGLQITDEPTIYDYLLLSLRSKDVVATFNWDPLLAQAHERNISVADKPDILYLHGNVGVGVCQEHRTKAFIWDECKKCGEPLSQSKLLFPIKKNYAGDPFIAGEWAELKHYLGQAYRITIFGYSAPVTESKHGSLC